MEGFLFQTPFSIPLHQNELNTRCNLNVKTYLDEFGKVGSISASAFGAITLPANGVIPIQMQTFEAVAPQETNGTYYKFSPGRPITYQSGIFVAMGISPTAK